MSKLQTILDEYLAVRRALGYKLYDTGLLLQQFVEFAEQSGAAYITTELALRWATQPAHARRTWWSSRLGVVRRFAQSAAATIRAPRCRRRVCFPILSFERRRTSIGTRRSGI
jgi:integrase/recombinase XerD